MLRSTKSSSYGRILSTASPARVRAVIHTPLSPPLWMNYTDVVFWETNCLGRSFRLPTRLGEFDPSALHQYSRTVTRSEVTDACWVFTVRWSAFSLWDVIRVRPNSVLPPVGAWSGRRKFSRSVDRGQGQADVPAEQPTPRARSRLPSSYAYACRSCNRFCASRQGPQGTHRLNHCSSELRSSGCYLSRTDCTAARISRVPCVEAVEWEDKTWLFTRSRETTHVRSSLSAPPDSD